MNEVQHPHVLQFMRWCAASEPTVTVWMRTVAPCASRLILHRQLLWPMRMIVPNKEPWHGTSVRTNPASKHPALRRYETSKHLWMVLEYCVGGDLQKLLEKDHRLPEPSIHDFARGIASSLQYCHHKVSSPVF